MLIRSKVDRNESGTYHTIRLFKGAAKLHGVSLNKSLTTGPDLLQNLMYVLLRFRQHTVALFADIERMFLQVGVLPCDQLSLRFLWREYPVIPLSVEVRI